WNRRSTMGDRHMTPSFRADMRRQVRLLVTGVVATLPLYGVACGGRDRATPERFSIDCFSRTQYPEPDRLRAMLVIQALVQAGDARSAHGENMVAPPAHDDVARAAEVLHCDRGPRAESRRRRAVAKLIAHDWDGERSTPLLRGIGFRDVGAVDDLK